MLKLLTGGASSGKSTTAVQWARRSEGPVALIVTGEARDQEMDEKIRRHKLQRPKEWLVQEEPVDMGKALLRVPESAFLIIDCLTLWVSNLIERGDSDEDIQKIAESTASLATNRAGETVAVTNEVGSGIVPINELARRYQGLLGNVNALWAREAGESYLVVAGKLLRLSDG